MMMMMISGSLNGLYDELFAAIDRGQIVDAKTIIAGQWLKLNKA